MRPLLVLTVLGILWFSLAVLAAVRIAAPVPADSARQETARCAEYWDERPEHPPEQQCWRRWHAVEWIAPAVPTPGVRP